MAVCINGVGAQWRSSNTVAAYHGVALLPAQCRVWRGNGVSQQQYRWRIWRMAKNNNGNISVASMACSNAYQ